ncbi:hypothetical protein D9M68_520520 [compost metagenome]
MSSSAVRGSRPATQSPGHTPWAWRKLAKRADSACSWLKVQVARLPSLPSQNRAMRPGSAWRSQHSMQALSASSEPARPSAAVA